MKSIILFSSIYATVFIFYVHSIGFCLTENIDLLLSISSGLIVSSKSNGSVSLECSNKTKVRRLTKAEQGQYVLPENLKQILVGLLLADLWANKRVTLATNSFTLEEFHLLAQTLEVKFNLICHINKLRNGYVIRISSKSLPVLQELLKNQMPSMMLYKIGL